MNPSEDNAAGEGQRPSLPYVRMEHDTVPLANAAAAAAAAADINNSPNSNEDDLPSQSRVSSSNMMKSGKPMKPGASLHRGVSGGARPPTNAYSTLVKELFTAGVPLTRVSELCKGFVSEQDINGIARKVVATAALADGGCTSAGDEKDSLEKTSFLPELGLSVLTRSKSASNDTEFLKGHTASLTSDAPESMIDPLFFNIMRDPVVISSGYVMDRSSVLDEGGDLKFHLCPFTRVPIKKDVYPLVCRKRDLHIYKERKVKYMVETARTLLDQRRFEQFWELIQLSEQFLDDIGDSTYIHLASRLANISLEGYEMERGADSCEPKELGKIYIRIYRASPTLNSMFNKKEGEKDGATDTITEEGLAEFEEFKNRLANLLKNAEQSIQSGKFDEAAQWLDACEMIHSSCTGMKVITSLSIAKLRLRLGKAKAVKDIWTLRRMVYKEIVSDPDAVASFCKEEEIEVDDLRDLTPMVLYRRTISEYGYDDEWHSAIESTPLESAACSVIVNAGGFKDQEWGNAKGNLGLVLYDDKGELVTRCNLFGTYRSDDYSYGDHPVRVFGKDDEIVSGACPGFKYALEYTIGGGGGHELHIRALHCKIFFEPTVENESFSFHSMADPEGDEGMYFGPTNDNNKAHGIGELVYYDEGCFIGKFGNGIMLEGVVYHCEEPKYTMLEGRWTGGLDGNITERYAYDVIHCSNRDGSDGSGSDSIRDSIDSDGSHEPNVTVSVRNSYSATVNLFWINTETGEEDPLDSVPIEPGRSDLVFTYHGHQFVAYNEDRTFQQEFTVSARRNEVEEIVIREPRRRRFRNSLRNLRSRLRRDSAEE